LRAIVVGKTGLQDRQAAGREQRTANPLQQSRGNQRRQVGRQPADQRRGGEPDHANHEHASPPEPIAQRAPEQNERRQRQQIARDGPLQSVDARLQIAADGRQRHVDDGAVEHDHR